MDKQIVVLIGGPGAGKTTLINELKAKGYTCFAEVSREVTNEARKQGIEQLFLEKPLLFSELLLEARVKQYESALTGDSKIIFLDRGIPDVLAYMHYIGDSYPKHFDEACKNHIYTKVFILPPWEEIYVSDEERYENYEQAKLIYQHLVETYKGYGYDLIEVPKGTIQERIDFLLSNLSN